ncbi:carboxypeptidase-like regulatory domain-containing protein [Pseudoalteromonas shioyasakiensis]|uniref:carboxypeptidase-like regulatory domain-containing protein n=1 Tax=Pseudoalteromonas shioyasakiensis TaxID=1190813 RepID=UPI0025520407|nr:carboxypeptidase-like regulatory domain-containing protein [Pseudoalteromonas shioyasakiensis]MDK9683249.1 carboxypeptidase-like regulatory domain-containing protein [Pseudoalteromonas shioyasakiensis]
MKRRIFKHASLSVAIVASLSLVTACGGSSNNDQKEPNPTKTTQVISGLVLDPEIKNATVSLFKNGQDDALASTTTNDKGEFSFDSAPAGQLADYYILATGGMDVKTGLNFNNIQLSTPLSHYNNYNELVVSPLSSLINKQTTTFDDDLNTLKALLGKFDITDDPRTNVALQQLTLKISALMHRGFNAEQIVSALDNEPGISDTDLQRLVPAEKRTLLARLKSRFASLDATDNTEQLLKTFKLGLIKTTLIEVSKLSSADLDTLPTRVKDNLNHLAEHFLQLAEANNLATLSEQEIIASISHGDELNQDFLNAASDADTPFSTASYRYIKVGLDEAIANNLDLMYYVLPNSATGNEQLVMHDVRNNTQTVVKTNVIINGRNFIFTGSKEGEKTTFTARKYGLMLDPNQHKETRTANSGPYGSFEYTFYSDNALMAYDANNPAVERTIFDSNQIPSELKGQVKVLGKEYKVVDNLNDADNSYAYIKAFESLPDTNRAELSGDKKQIPLTVRLSDGAVTAGRPLALLHNEQGLTEHVIVSYAAVHTDSYYPSASSQRKRLQLCDPSLTNCDDIADGDYYFTAQNNEFIYFTRQGYSDFYGLNKTDLSFTKLSGSQYPAAFDAERHLQGASGHGGDTVLNNFSSLGGITTHLSSGDTAYAVVNYDLDTDTPLGTFFQGSPYELPMHIHKNGQVIKFNGLNATRMFDTGDGIDHGDASEGEALGGHINLLTAENDKLFIEIANYNAQSVGGTCVPERGFGCFNVRYGQLAEDSQNKTQLDSILASKDNLKYLYVRRLPPFSINGVLYINLMDKPADRNTGFGHQYHLQSFNTDTLAKVNDTVGRSYFTLSARYDDGRIDGEVLAWDAKTGELKNISRNLVIDANMHNGIDDKHMIQSVLGAANGLPVAGLGTVFALRADPGRHQWFMVAGDASSERSLAQIDQLPFASWLYY